MEKSASMTMSGSRGVKAADMYAGASNELYSPQYWKHWNSEVITADSVFKTETTLRSTQHKAQRRAKAAEKAQMKLTIQWELDHPFAKPNPRGRTRGAAANMNSDEARLATIEPDYITEYRLQSPRKPKTAKGGKFAQSTRLDAERILLSKEHAAAVPPRHEPGPGTYNHASTLGPQMRSTWKSAPSFSFTEVTKPPDDNCGPGPGAYNVKLARSAKTAPFSTAQRLADHGKLSAAPGPIYKVPSYMGGTFGGPAFSFSTGNDNRRGLAAILNPPPREDNIAHVVKPQGFGYGCVVEEHIKYGHCLDGRCSRRGQWEAVQTRHAEKQEAAERTHQATLSALMEASQQAEASLQEELALVEKQLAEQKAEEDEEQAAGEGEGGMTGWGHGDERDVMSAPAGIGSSSIDALASRATAKEEEEEEKQQKELKRKSRLKPIDVVTEPVNDIFPPVCMACGDRVSCMTTKERILATNRALAVHHKPIVSHVVRPGKKRSLLHGEREPNAMDAPALNSARSVMSLSSIPSAKSLPTVSAKHSVISSSSSRTSRRRRRKRPNKLRGTSSVSSESTWEGSPRSGMLSKGAAKSGWAGGVYGADGIERLIHQPENTVYIPGCGYFCDKACVRQYVVANVSPDGSSSNSKRNVKRPALLHCVLHNNLEELSFMLRSGSNCNITAEQRRYPLHIAAQEGHTRILERLFCGAFNVLKYQECARHHNSERQSDKKKTKKKTCYCYNQRPDVNCQDIDGATPLHLAARNGHLSAVQCLLKYGASTEILDYNGVAPHETAVKQDIFQLLKNATAVKDAVDHLRTQQLKSHSVMRRTRGLDRTMTPQPIVWHPRPPPDVGNPDDNYA